MQGKVFVYYCTVHRLASVARTWLQLLTMLNASRGRLSCFHSVRLQSRATHAVNFVNSLGTNSSTELPFSVDWIRHRWWSEVRAKSKLQCIDACRPTSSTSASCQAHMRAWALFRDDRFTPATRLNAFWWELGTLATTSLSYTRTKVQTVPNSHNDFHDENHHCGALVLRMSFPVNGTGFFEVEQSIAIAHETVAICHRYQVHFSSEFWKKWLYCGQPTDIPLRHILKFIDDVKSEIITSFFRDSEAYIPNTLQSAN